MFFWILSFEDHLFVHVLWNYLIQLEKNKSLFEAQVDDTSSVKESRCQAVVLAADPLITPPYHTDDS